MAKGETEVIEPSAGERAIARRAAESRATVPHLELGAVVQAGAAVALCERERVSMTAALARACALALREVPRANASYRDGRFELYSHINVGVVLQSASGQTTPTLSDADGKPLAQLDRELSALAGRAAQGQLTQPELSGATFTLSDLGPLGVDRPGIVPSPTQAAAIAAGRVRAVPLVIDGAIVPGQIMELTLAADHRILFGAEAARFLDRIRELLERANL
jgi:pyruvate dehydrogenase E2 component (dihydrolipoamide acetyltransferase)